MIKDKMPKAKSSTLSPSSQSTSAIRGLTANDIYATGTMPRIKLYRHEPQNKELADRVRKLVKQSPMGSGSSKERTSRSQQRSAAQRLLDQRKSNGPTKIKPPSRSKSVGDGIQRDSAFQSLPQTTEFKSVENLPAEIRDKFNPFFAKELHTIVRQKSQRRELFGFHDPTEAKKSSSEVDLIDQIDKSFMSSTPRTPRKSESSVLQPLSKPSRNNENRKSAHDALFPTYKTFPSIKHPQVTSVDPFMNTNNFNGTNNSASYSMTLGKSLGSKSSLASSEYDNVRKAEFIQTTNRPVNRVDQPPPKSAGVARVPQSSIMKILNRSQGNIDKSSTGGHSTQSSRSDLGKCQSQMDTPPTRTKSQTILRTNIRPPQGSTKQNEGRMFCVSSREPMLICRNSACSNQATLKQAKADYKSCRYCVTFYCTKECRAEHWHKHKEKCVYAKAASLAKLILHQISHNCLILNSLAQIASREERTKGRGAVRVVVGSIAEAEAFVLRGLAALTTPPEYLGQGSLDSEMSAIADKYSLDEEILVDVMLRITSTEKLVLTRPYRTNSEFISTGSRMRRPKNRFIEIRKGHTSGQKVVEV